MEIGPRLAACFSRPVLHRDAGSYENLRGRVLIGGHNLPPLIELGLTDLQKSRGATPRNDRPGMVVSELPWQPLHSQGYIWC